MADFPQQIMNDIVTIAGSLKALAFGPQSRSSTPEPGVPKSLENIAASLSKIEVHLAKLAEK